MVYGGYTLVVYHQEQKIMNDLIEILITDKIKKIDLDKVYNCLTVSKSSEFYSELFSETFQGKEMPELYAQNKLVYRMKGEAYSTMNEIVSYLKKQLNNTSVVIEIGGGVYQQRSGNAHEHFKYYYPLDISYSSIKRYAEKFDKAGIVADAKELPFKTNSIDCIFTHTFLEHPLEPEKVLEEITRVLKPGGIVIHNDAWFCRWWQRYGIVGLKKFSNMTFFEKMIWICAKFTEIPIIRISPIIINRIFNEILPRKKKQIELRYKKLTPNYKLHLGCDEDAASRIDPVDVMRFYESRDFYLINPLTLKQRILYPNKYIMLKKKAVHNSM